MALATAAVVKLTRVLLLAPLVALLGLRRPDRRQGGGRLLFPPFVLLFVGAIAVASTGVVGDDALSAIDWCRSLLLAAALFAIGTRVDARRLAKLGVRPLVLGLASWALVATLAYVGVLIAWNSAV